MKIFSAFALFLMMIVLLLVSKKLSTVLVKNTNEKLVPVVSMEPEDASSEVSGKWHGLCGKNSIKSVDDFRRTVQKDTRLALHYSGFDWSKAKIGNLEKPTLAFVSYRSNGDGMIQSPTKKVTLPKGDGYITDGKKWVRTYCCNDFVVAPPSSATEAKAPPMRERVVQPAYHDIVAGPPLQLSSAPPVQISEGSPSPRDGRSPDPGLSFRPSFPLYTSSQPRYQDKPGPPDVVVVPEPGTLSLLGIGIAGLGLAQWLRRKRK